MSTNTDIAAAFEAAARKVLSEVAAPEPQPGSFQMAISVNPASPHPSSDPAKVAKAQDQAETLRLIADVYRRLPAHSLKSTSNLPAPKVMTSGVGSSNGGV